MELLTFLARAGGTDRAHLYSNGNLNISGGMQASSVNLQNSSTSSWFQTGTSIASYPYVWAAAKIHHQILGTLDYKQMVISIWEVI